MGVTMAVLTGEDVEARLGNLDGWRSEGDAITRQFEFKDFVGSVDFVNRITPLAEEMNHHPDLAISWNKVTVKLFSYTDGALTENDFELASKIDGAAG